MTWEMFGVASRALAQMVADDGYEPDMILAIARGGLLIGGALGYALVGEERLHDERRVLHRRRRAPRGAADPAAGARLRRSHDARILIADDVADTGHTLRSVQEFCEGKVAEVRTRGAVREAAFGRAVRLRVEAHRPVDQLPVERQGPRRQARLGGQGRLSSVRRGRSDVAAVRAAAWRAAPWAGRRRAGVPPRQTVTIGCSGLSLGSTEARSSSGSAWASRLNGAISDVSIDPRTLLRRHRPELILEHSPSSSPSSPRTATAPAPPSRERCQIIESASMSVPVSATPNHVTS